MITPASETEHSEPRKKQPLTTQTDLTEEERAKNFQINRNKLIQYVHSGIKSREDFMIGLELEHFVLDEDDIPLIFPGEKGMGKLLETLAELMGEPIMVDNHLMGVKGKLNGLDFTITIEPACQFEISVGPSAHLASLADAYVSFRDSVEEAFKVMEVSYSLVTAGYNPVVSAHEMPIIDKKRYHLMDRHFRNRGTLGVDMMRGSGSTQISIDYSDKDSLLERYQLAAALGPLIALITDNASIFRGSPNYQRMIRSIIWRSTDAERCGLVPDTFSDSFGAEAYIDWLLSTPAILVIDEQGESHSTGDKTIGELIEDYELNTAEIEHFLSMVFPDVRIKKFIEIRDGDSIPPLYAFALLALVKGIFNDCSECPQIQELTQDITDMDVLTARSELIAHGYDAKVYGYNAGELLDKLIAAARKALPEEEVKLLEPLATLINERTTLREQALKEMGLDPDNPPLTEEKLNQEFAGVVKELEGDLEGRHDAHEYLKDSYAIRKGEVITWAYTPKFYTKTTALHFKDIAEKTHRIMEKATAYYLEHPEYQKLFGFSKELQELTNLDPGYDRLIPLSRVDIFYNEKTRDFKFCEFNTDASSGQTFISEPNQAIAQTESFKRFAEHHTITEYPLHEGWVKAFLEVYDSSEHALEHPHVAIVDYLESIMLGDANLYARMFRDYGVHASVVDIRDLRYENGKLLDANGDVIDVVWRRAVTSEMLEKRGEGAQALVDAAKNNDVCLIGSFRTWPAAVKDFLTILLSGESAEFLSPEEVEFVKRHTPITEVLDRNIDLTLFSQDKDKWILKPREGYGGVGVIAGIDVETDKQWARLLKEHQALGSSVIQEYITPYKTPVALAGTNDADALTFFEADNLVGLYVYDGTFGGIYSRAGRTATITSGTENINLPTFIVED